MATTTTDLSTLKIHKLTTAQYQAETKNPNELYFLTDYNGYLRTYVNNTDLANLDIVGNGNWLYSHCNTQGGPTTVTKPSNSTNNAWSILAVNGHQGNYSAQLFFNIQAGTLHYRTAANTTTFGSWKQIAFTDGTITSASKLNITSTKEGIAYFTDTSGTIASTSAGSAGYLLQGNGGSTAPSWIQATNSNTNSTIVKRDSSGNFSAGTITASLTGNVTGNLTGNVTGYADNISGVEDVLIGWGTNGFSGYTRSIIFGTAKAPTVTNYSRMKIGSYLSDTKPSLYCAYSTNDGSTWTSLMSIDPDGLACNLHEQTTLNNKTIVTTDMLGSYLNSSALNTALNRTTAVNVADTNYTTYMARGVAMYPLNSSSVPTVNGTIAWYYE